MKTSKNDRGLTRSVVVSRRHANSPVPSTNPAVLAVYIFELEKSLVTRLSRTGLHKLVTEQIAFLLRIYLTKLAEKLRSHRSLVKSIEPIMVKEWSTDRWHKFVDLWVNMKRLPDETSRFDLFVEDLLAELRTTDHEAQPIHIPTS